MFYSYILMVRVLEGVRCGLCLCGGLLLQQYVVDAYVKAEGQRLKWIRENQPNLRSEQLQGLIDHVGSDAGAASGNASGVGRQVLLPSSFPGGPRAMIQNYYDAMAIVRRRQAGSFLDHDSESAVGGDPRLLGARAVGCGSS